MNPGEYARTVESYLCRKNDGHLIRIVGPVFEQVCGWAARGVPLSIVCGGIDRYFARYYAKGPRRRPVRIEHCEADVLDLFDEWRRAVGIPMEMVEARARTDEREGGAEIAPADAATKSPSPSKHLERVIARLQALRQDAGLPDGLRAAIERVEGAIDHARQQLQRARGPRRGGLLEELARFDDQLLEAARQDLDDAALAGLRREAMKELEPFRERMTDVTYERALDACLQRLVRERANLPRVAFD